MKTRSVAGVASVLRGTGSITEKIGALNRIIKEPGDLDEALNKGLITHEEVQKIYGRARRYDAHKDIEAALPMVAEERMRATAGLPASAALPTAAMTPAERTALAAAYSAEIVSKIPPGRAGNLSASALEDKAVMEAIVSSWHGNQVGKLVERHGRLAVDGVQNAILRIGGRTAMAGTPGVRPGVNPGLLKYLDSQAGQAAGFTI